MLTPGRRRAKHAVEAAFRFARLSVVVMCCAAFIVFMRGVWNLFRSVIRSNVDIKNVNFKNVNFKNVDFKNVDFKNVDFKNVDFKNVDFKNVDL
jgi:uncharacterized protein YjbI with pentapeptide repeats